MLWWSTIRDKKDQVNVELSLASLIIGYLNMEEPSKYKVSYAHIVYGNNQHWD